MPTLADLEKHLAELQAQERQAFANFNAVLGARQFCERLIADLRAEEKKDADT